MNKKAKAKNSPTINIIYTQFRKEISFHLKNIFTFAK